VIYHPIFFGCFVVLFKIWNVHNITQVMVPYFFRNKKARMPVDTRNFGSAHCSKVGLLAKVQDKGSALG